jgi:hypothetical protein
VPRLFAVSTLFLLLAGCATGGPFAHGPDPGADASLHDAEPLVAQCRQHFAAALGTSKVTVDDGPTVERDGDFTGVSLVARPVDPDALHPYRYSCRFESGALTDARMAP